MSDGIHIAFVCPRFAKGATVGGAETLFKNMAYSACRAGHRVVYLTTCAEDHFTWENKHPPGTFNEDGLDVTYFPVDEDRDVGTFLSVQSEISRGIPVSEEKELSWINNSVNSRALCQHLEREGSLYNLVITGPYLFGLVYHAARISAEKTLLIPCLHDEPFAYLKLMRTLFQSVAGLLFNTVPEQSFACRLFDLDRDRCRVVGMGLDPFEVDASVGVHGLPVDAPYVLYSGRREPMKGTTLLCDYLHAFRERTGRDVKLVFTGRGAIEAPVELEPHITDLGFVSEEEKRRVMAGAAVFVHPSTYESLGIVLLESWLAGTPALVHAGSEVLTWQCRQSGGGLWFRYYPEFEEELLFLLDHADMARELARAGRAYVLREYSWTAVEKRFNEAVHFFSASS